MPEHNDDSGGNGWLEWKRQVLMQAQAHDDAIKRIDTELKNMGIEIALLKYKSSFWGAAGAALVVAGYALMSYLSKGH
jgi:hypothetical protein